MRWLALAGVLAVTATGGIAYAALRSPPSIGTTSAHWGLYSNADWTRLASAFEQRGFAQGSVWLVAGAGTPARPLALLAARRDSGRECFAVARGGTLGRTMCRPETPLAVFRLRGSMVVLARPDVRWVMSTSGTYRANEPLWDAGDGFHAFDGDGIGGHPTMLVAHGAHDRVLQSVTVR